MSVHMIGMGYVLLLPPIQFDQPAWSFFRLVFQDEDLLGWILVALGVLRFGGLIVNGARKDITPMIRQVSAGIGCMIWAGMSYCYAQSGIVGLWLAIFPVFALGELVNIHRAAHDQGEARNGSTG